MGFTRLLILALSLMVACARDGQSGSTAPAASQSVMRAQARNGVPTEFVDPGAPDPRPVREAVAVLVPTRGSDVRGVVRFVEADNGLEMTTRVEGLEAGGVHAYHVHVYGDCSSPEATSAGPHYHFRGSSLDPRIKMITGDLGEVRPQQGEAHSDHAAKVTDASLHGPFSIIGRSVILHAQGNDPSKTPDGGAGARIACGVIGVANPEPSQE